MSVYLGIDLGTQSLKVIAYDAQQRVVLGSGNAPIDMISKPDGTREQLADWWLDALRTALGQIDSVHRSAVKAIGVSGQQHGFVPVDDKGTVLAPVKLWCDTSTTRECEEIAQQFGGQQRCIDEVGNAILPGYTASKIRWLKKHRPDAYAAMTCVLLPHDYINFYLTGERFHEYGDASGTGLLDIRTRSWHSAIVAAVDPDGALEKCLPGLIGPQEVGGTLLASVASELGLPAGVPVASGGGDNMMAAIATGNLAPGRLTISLGTSGTMFAYSDTPCLDPKGELAAFCSSTGGWLPLLCTMNCTVATEQARNLFGKDLTGFDQQIAGTQPGAEGVVVLPFYNGERTPNLPNGKGCIVGLNQDNMSQSNILRASMESAVYGLRLGLDAFERSGCELTEIRLTGGAAKNPVWRQMIADNFALPVRTLAAEEGAAMGAALNAMLLEADTDGGSASLAAIIDEHVVFDEQSSAHPDKQLADCYSEHYQTYCNYLTQLTPLFE